MRKLMTINISPRPVYGVDILKLYDNHKYRIRKALNPCTDHYLIYPELDKNDRLHYHGVVIIKDPIKWYRSCKRKLQDIGFCKFQKLKNITNQLQWQLYMSKDWGVNQHIFDKPILPHRFKRNKRTCNRGCTTRWMTCKGPVTKSGGVYPPLFLTSLSLSSFRSPPNPLNYSLKNIISHCYIHE